MHQLTSRIFDVMSHFQDGIHDIISQKAFRLHWAVQAIASL